MRVYVSRLMDRWLSGWTVTTLILLGVSMGYLLSQHYFSDRVLYWMLMYGLVGVLGGLGVASVYGHADGNRQRELIFGVSAVISFLNSSNLEMVIGCLGGLWIGYAGVISFISFIAEMNETHALFRRQRLSTKTMRAFPDISKRSNWLVTHDAWELPPKRMYWHPVLVLLLSGLVIVFVVCLMAFFT